MQISSDLHCLSRFSEDLCSLSSWLIVRAGRPSCFTSCPGLQLEFYTVYHSYSLFITYFGVGLGSGGSSFRGTGESTLGTERKTAGTPSSPGLRAGAGYVLPSNWLTSITASTCPAPTGSTPV